MAIFKPAREMSLEEFIKKYLPVNHNDKDILYLKARHAWEVSDAVSKADKRWDTKSMTERLKERRVIVDALIHKMFEAYQGTTFQAENYPKEAKKYRAEQALVQQQAQRSLF